MGTLSTAETGHLSPTSISHDGNERTCQCARMAPMRPMLATRGSRVPAGAEWVHEVKWDGMRVLADVTRRARCG